MHKAQKHGWDNCPSPSLPAAEIEDFIVEQIRSVGQDPGVIRDTLGPESYPNPDDYRTSQERKERVRAGNTRTVQKAE